MKNLIFKNFKWLLVPLVLLTLSIGIVRGTEYTYTSFTTSFVKGTTNGTDINDGLPGSLSTLASSGSSNFADFSGTYCYYKSTGAGIRISKKDNAGNITFTLSSALQDSAIYALVIYASKVSGNANAKLDITPTGPAINGYTTVTNITNGTLPAYNTSRHANSYLSDYKLDTIKVNGKKIETLDFASASKGYTMLHAITIVTQTEKAAPAGCSTYTFILLIHKNLQSTTSQSRTNLEPISSHYRDPKFPITLFLVIYIMSKIFLLFFLVPSSSTNFFNLFV